MGTKNMNGWQWFWTLVGYIIFIIVLIFLYFYKPFEDLFNLIVYGLSYNNSIFWTGIIIGIIGFCTFHWRAYRLHIEQQQSIESMVLSSLLGSTYTAILISAAATLQTVQILCASLIQPGFNLDGVFGRQLGATIALVILTALFCLLFWLLKIIRTPAKRLVG
jgi:hypothetical protein